MLSHLLQFICCHYLHALALKKSRAEYETLVRWLPRMIHNENPCLPSHRSHGIIESDDSFIEVVSKGIGLQMSTQTHIKNGSLSKTK